MNERFPPKRAGQQLSAADLNRQQQALERLLSGGASGGLARSANAAFEGLSLPAGGPVALVRMLREVVPQEPLLAGQVPTGFQETANNAVLQTWDADGQRWVDAAGTEFVADNPTGSVYDRDQFAVCHLHQDTGRWLLAADGAVRLAVTGLAPSGGDGFGPWYPDPDDLPSTYFVTFVNAPFAPVAGANFLSEAEAQEAGETPVPLSDMGPPSGPHVAVMNLYQGPDSYLPPGTPLWCFRAGGRWFTHTKPDAAPERQVEVIRLLGGGAGSVVPYGLLDAQVEVWSEVAGCWLQGQRVWAVDANAGSACGSGA